MDNKENDEEYYEPDILSVTDDNGEEILFELLERYETEDNNVYVAITEYHDDEEEILDAAYEILFLKVEEDGDNEYLVEIEDADEYSKISEILMKMVEDKYDVEYYSDDDED